MRDVTHKLFQEEFRLSSHAHAEQVLQRMRRDRETLVVIPGGHGEEYRSLVLEVNRREGWLIIDELQPDLGNRRLGEGLPFFAMGRAERIYAGFQGELMERLLWQGYGALRVGFPRAVFYLQRREFFRVPVSLGDVGSVELLRRGAAALRANCLDISASGIRVTLPLEEDYALHVGERLQAIRFTLQEVFMELQAEVRYVEALGRLPRRNVRQVGLRFVDVAPRLRERILQYVQRRDRELLRGNRRGS